MLFELKITNRLKSSRYGQEKSDLPWEQNYKPTKFQGSVPQIGQDSSVYILDIILGWVYDIISHLICIFYTFFFDQDLSCTGAKIKHKVWINILGYLVTNLTKNNLALTVSCINCLQNSAKKHGQEPVMDPGGRDGGGPNPNPPFPNLFFYLLLA